MRVLKKILRFLGYIVLVWVLFFAGYVAWSIYREPIAQQAAKDMCASLSVGQVVEGLRERAFAAGADETFSRWRELADGRRQFDGVFVGAPPFSRHICKVVINKDRVETAEYLYLD